MHQDLRDSVWFCYKKAKTTYDELLNETLDAKWEKFTKVKTTSLKVKSAVTTLEDGGIEDLKQKIDQLTMVVKSSTFAGTNQRKEILELPMLPLDNTQVRIRVRNLQAPIKVRDLLHLRLGHSRVDRSHINVTTVEDGGIVTDSAQVRGASIEGA